MRKFTGFFCIAVIALFSGFNPAAVTAGEEFYSGLVIESQDELDAAEVMPMVRAGGKSIPSKFDLSEKMPPVGSQGRQGSCVAWATTYYVKSYHEMIKNRWEYGWGNYNPFYSKGIIPAEKGNHVFSPAWTYNQINGGRDSGSSINRAFKLLCEKGAVPWSVMPYNHQDYRTQPTSAMRSLAYSKYRARSYTRVITGDPANIKREIAAGNPVVGGFKVTAKWKRPSKEVSGGGVFDDHTGSVTGGHAMAVVGYDDSKVSPSGQRGAFKIINSWGDYWGNRGYFWMSYRTFTLLCKYAYVLYDSEGSVVPDNNNRITVKATDMVTATKGTMADKVYVSWNRVAGAVSYIVERSIGDSRSFKRAALVSTNSYNDTSIQSDFRYNYRIVTVTADGRSRADDSPVAEGFALKKNSRLPAQVANLTVASSGSSVVLRWTAVPGAKYYRVVRYDQGRRKWNDIGRITANSFRDSRPLKKVPNYYYVAALNAAGQGKWSNLVKLTITSYGGTPSVVSGVKATRGTYSDRIYVNWNSQPAAEHYVLYRWDSSARKWDKSWRVRGSSYTDRSSKVSNGKRFIYTVKAWNRQGSSSRWSSYVTGYTSRQKSMAVSLRSGMGAQAPKQVRASVDESSRTVKVTWEKASMLAAYKVYRKKENDRDFSPVKTLAKGVNSFSEKFPGEDGEIFFYQVRAVVLGGESEASETVSATIEEFSPTVMTTFVPGEGLKNFRGTWRASHLRSDGSAVGMEITVKDRGSRFTASINYGGKKREIKGDYAAKSRYLEAKNFSFRMLPAFDNDVANVVIPAGVFTSSRIVVNFSRENQD